MLTDEEAEKSKQRIYESERAKQADGAKLMDSSPLSSLYTIHRLLLAVHEKALFPYYSSNELTFFFLSPKLKNQIMSWVNIEDLSSTIIF